MKTRAMRQVTARYTWDRLRVSFWFTPMVMAILAILLAWMMYALDMLIPNQRLFDSRFILSGTVGDLRNSLLTIAATVLTTAGVVFTLLTLPLSTVAAQYGSRLLRVFLADRTTQMVLGMFVGTFVYCIAAALSIPSGITEPESPQLTASVGLYLMMATFATLILLVQHISTMLQAPNIAAAAGEQLLDVVQEDTSPEARRDARLAEAAVSAPLARNETDGDRIHSRGSGYIQAVDPEIIVTLAQEQDVVVRVVSRPGTFVRSGDVVALVWPEHRIDERSARQLEKAFRIGNQRTPTQDVECAVNQLVEMAVRAMSPAINDPFTAMTCLDHIALGLAQFVKQGGESPDFYDDSGRLRFVFEPVTFDELLCAAFDMLRHASCDNASVLLHMLKAIESVSAVAKSRESRMLLKYHVRRVEEESATGNLIEYDRRRVEQSAAILTTKLDNAA